MLSDRARELHYLVPRPKKQFLSTAETASLERTDQGHIHYAFMRGCQLLRKYNESAGTLVKGLAVTDLCIKCSSLIKK